jgi:predicted enzyme related to lactoylglutathione lyase
VRTPTFSVEVITLPVSDVERALRFYVDQVGFTLDVDYAPNDGFGVVQLTPPGSRCSIQMGKGITDATVGSLRNVYLVVSDLEAARSRLLERGVEVGEIRHKTPIGAWDGGFAPALVIASVIHMEGESHGTVLATRSALTGSHRPVPRARAAAQETVVR